MRFIEENTVLEYYLDDRYIGTYHSIDELIDDCFTNEDISKKRQEICTLTLQKFINLEFTIGTNEYSLTNFYKVTIFSDELFTQFT